jgi:hypothetical protein
MNQWSKCYGVTLDSLLLSKTHASCVIHKANYRLRQLFPAVNKSYTIDINLALTLYKSVLRSILAYVSAVWEYTAKAYVNKLQAFQNEVLSKTTKFPRVTSIEFLHKQTEVSLMKDHIKRVASAPCKHQQWRVIDSRVTWWYWRLLTLVAR